MSDQKPNTLSNLSPNNQKKATKKCPTCGKTLPSYARKCKYCDTILKPSKKASQVSIPATKDPSIATPEHNEFEQLCNIIEERRSTPLSEVEREVLHILYERKLGERINGLSQAQQGALDTLVAFIVSTDASDELRTRLNWEHQTNSFPKIDSNTIAFFFFIIFPNLVLTGLWGWFSPIDNETPEIIKSVILGLAGVCLIIAIVIDIILKQWRVIIVLASVIIVLGLIVISGQIDQIVNQRFGGVVNFSVATTGFASIIVIGEIVESFWGGLGSVLLNLSDFQWRNRKYILAVILGLLGIVLLVFQYIWPFGHSKSSSN